MASSLISINEATIGELQQLEGIGPKRSIYIVDFRNRVDLIRNTFDLATATGLSIKAAERLSPRIDWKTDAMPPFGFWPAGLVTLASLWFVVRGLQQLSTEQFFAPYSYYNLSLALILLGGLAATGDIAVTMIRGHSHKSIRVSILSACLFILGFVILILLSISTVLVTYPTDFQNTLRSTIQFIGYCGLMFWLIYDPAFCLRFSSKMAGWRSLIHQSSCTIYLLHLLRFCHSTTYRFTTTETGRPRCSLFGVHLSSPLAVWIQ